jgi:hypothetical protein
VFKTSSEAEAEQWVQVRVGHLLLLNSAEPISRCSHARCLTLPSHSCALVTAVTLQAIKAVQARRPALIDRDAEAAAAAAAAANAAVSA